MTDEMIFENDVKHNPALCALYAVLRYKQYMNKELKKILEELRTYILDGMPLPKDARAQHKLDVKLNDLGEAASDISHEYREKSESGEQDKSETPRFYALAMLAMSLRNLASVAWGYALARELPDRTDGAYDSVESAVGNCWGFLGFRDSDVDPDREAVKSDEKAYQREVKFIPGAPVTRQELQTLLHETMKTDKDRANVLSLLLTSVE